MTPLATAEEIAGLLRVPRARVYEMARAGSIAGVVRVGRLVRFRLDAIEGWIAEGGSPLPGGWRRETDGAAS
jgi:excisionase family DNA binding protein